MEKHCSNCGHVDALKSNITYVDIDLFGENLFGGDISDIGYVTSNAKDNDPNQHNGLITKIWGPSGWEFEHAVTFGYPVEPSDTQKQDYFSHFKSLGNILPCRYCRESYKIFIESEPTILNMDVMKSRATLTRWLYDVHQRVNQKLGVDYGISYEDVVDRYESFRARCKSEPGSTQKGCVSPLDYKAFSFRKLNSHDPPLIPVELVDKFVAINKNAIEPEWLMFYIFAKQQNLTAEQIKHQHKEVWCDRNRYCQQIIKEMRENSIPPTVDGHLTYGELRLILMLSSNMTKDELEKIAY
jgi:hypothetical protein